MACKIKCHMGQASDIIPQLDKVFDLVCIDADKKSYRYYYDLVFHRIRPCGFIIVDNVFWAGEVLTRADQPEKKYSNYY